MPHGILFGLGLCSAATMKGSLRWSKSANKAMRSADDDSAGRIHIAAAPALWRIWIPLYADTHDVEDEFPWRVRQAGKDDDIGQPKENARVPEQKSLRDLGGKPPCFFSILILELRCQSAHPSILGHSYSDFNEKEKGNGFIRGFLPPLFSQPPQESSCWQFLQQQVLPKLPPSHPELRLSRQIVAAKRAVLANKLDAFLQQQLFSELVPFGDYSLDRSLF